MTDSILNTIKKGCQLSETYNAYDSDIIIHINAVFMFLSQIGVGPSKPFHITGDKETWSDFMTNETMLEAVKSYMVMRVKYIFDPPTSGTTMEALKASIAELEWRLNVQVDPENTFGSDSDA